MSSTTDPGRGTSPTNVKSCGPGYDSEPADLQLSGPTRMMAATSATVSALQNDRGSARRPPVRQRHRREDGPGHASCRKRATALASPETYPSGPLEVPHRVVSKHPGALCHGLSQRCLRRCRCPVQMDDDLTGTRKPGQVGGTLQHELWPEGTDHGILAAGRFALAAVHRQYRCSR